MEDFRVKTAWRHSRKRKRLVRMIGSDAVLAVYDLWSYCAESRQNGDLKGLSNRDIADEINYGEDPDILIQALLDVAILDGQPGKLSVHHWAKHNPYVNGYKVRSDKAKNAATKRWDKKGSAKQLSPKNIEDMLNEQSSNAKSYFEHNEHDKDMLDRQSSNARSENGNAPSPSPSPSPSPFAKREGEGSTTYPPDSGENSNEHDCGPPEWDEQPPPDEPLDDIPPSPPFDATQEPPPDEDDFEFDPTERN